MLSHRSLRWASHLLGRVCRIATHSAPFVSREDFRFDPDLKWFPPHMAKATIGVTKKLPSVDLVVEVRDARHPLSSAQFELDSIVRARPGRKRLIVLNKQDLAPKKIVKEAVALLNLQGVPVFPTSAVDATNVESIVNFLREHARGKFKSLGATMMIVGLPNTGKSTLLNALKYVCPRPAVDKAPAKISGLPGSTKEIGRIQISVSNPKIYVLDTPGVMLTHSGLGSQAPESLMKAAVVGSMPDTLVGNELLCDYILFLLNKRRLFQYVSKYGLAGPTNDSDQVLLSVAKSISGGTSRVDLLGAAARFVSHFRKGILGKLCLDELPDVEEVGRKISDERNFVFRTEPPGPWGPCVWPEDSAVLRSIYK